MKVFVKIIVLLTVLLISRSAFLYMDKMLEERYIIEQAEYFCGWQSSVRILGLFIYFVG